MFRAAQFTIAKTRKQLKCPLTEEWIKKMWHIYIYIYIHTHTHIHTYTHTMEYYSALEKNEIMLFAATWTDLEIVILNEVSHTERDTYHKISLIEGM